ncbi:hypothetical protein D3C86_1207410 [compost metagenome]
MGGVVDPDHVPHLELMHGVELGFQLVGAVEVPDDPAKLVQGLDLFEVVVRGRLLAILLGQFDARYPFLDRRLGFAQLAAGLGLSAGLRKVRGQPPGSGQEAIAEGGQFASCGDGSPGGAPDSLCLGALVRYKGIGKARVIAERGADPRKFDRLAARSVVGGKDAPRGRDFGQGDRQEPEGQAVEVRVFEPGRALGQQQVAAVAPRQLAACAHQKGQARDRAGQPLEAIALLAERHAAGLAPPLAGVAPQPSPGAGDSLPDHELEVEVEGGKCGFLGHGHLRRAGPRGPAAWR